MSLTTEQVWRTLGSSLRKYLDRRVTDPALAEDLLQEVFVRIHRGIASLNDETRVGPWVYQIARNTLANSRRRRESAPLVEEPANPVTDTDDALDRELAACVASMVQQLPEAYRDTLVMAELKGAKHREVADRLGLSISAVKSRVQRGRQQLKEMLLDCCHFELDGRGGVVDWQPRGECRNCTT